MQYISAYIVAAQKHEREPQSAGFCAAWAPPPRTFYPHHPEILCAMDDGGGNKSALYTHTFTNLGTLPERAYRPCDVVISRGIFLARHWPLFGLYVLPQENRVTRCEKTNASTFGDTWYSGNPIDCIWVYHVPLTFAVDHHWMTLRSPL